MPVVSQAQNAAMHAAAQGSSTLGIPKSVGQDFVNASHGMSVSNLPKKVSTFKHHASAAAKAHAAGDHKTAMHHAGHMLRMARSASQGGSDTTSGLGTRGEDSSSSAPDMSAPSQSSDTTDPVSSIPSTQPGGLGNFLNRRSPMPPKAAPPIVQSPKPSFGASVRSRFASLRGK